MYKIELFYQSQFKGVYRKEQETTNNVDNTVLDTSN